MTKTWKEAISVNPLEMSLKDYTILMSKAFTDVKTKKELKENICDYFTVHVKPIIDRNLDSKYEILRMEIGRLCDLYEISISMFGKFKFRGFDIQRETKYIVNKIYKTHF